MAENIITGVQRVVDLFDQSGHTTGIDTDLTSVAHDGVAGTDSPSATKTGGFVAPFSGMARIAFSLSAVATIKLTENVPSGSVVTHTLNAGVKLQTETLSFPVRRGWEYEFQTGESVTLYSLVIDVVKE